MVLAYACAAPACERPDPLPVPPAVASASGFDPATVAPGDTVAGLVLVRRDADLVFGDSAWVGTFTFRGRLELDGVYQRHFDYPEPDLVCFHVLGESIDRVPRLEPDAFVSPGMKPWFCFTNQERARELLGDAASPREATIVVNEYTVNRYFTDAFSTAELVEVTRLGGPARNTLRDPIPDSARSPQVTPR